DGGDGVLEDRAPAERQGQLGPAHARASTAGREQGDRHGRAAPGRTRTRASGMVAPRFRQAISSATMLTAISGPVCAPMAKPGGRAPGAALARGLPWRAGPRN